ncbi:hypothetical protein P5V15_001351 [Pogonomyrmex californicus]
MHFMTDNILTASDELNQVFEKYTSVIVLGQSPKFSATKAFKSTYNEPSLLDLSSPTETVSCKSSLNMQTTSADHRSDMDMLGDIFNVLENPIKLDASFLTPNVIMQPISISPINKKSEHNS